MAKTAITNDKLNLNELKKVNFTAGTTDGFKFDFSADDGKMVLIFQNTASANGTVTVKAGNGLQGVVDLDAFTIPQNEYAACRIDSGMFKNVTGEDAGFVIVVPSATTIKACAIQLP